MHSVVRKFLPVLIHFALDFVFVVRGTLSFVHPHEHCSPMFCRHDSIQYAILTAPFPMEFQLILFGFIPIMQSLVDYASSHHLLAGGTITALHL